MTERRSRKKKLFKKSVWDHLVRVPSPRYAEGLDPGAHRSKCLKGAEPGGEHVGHGHDQSDGDHGTVRIVGVGVAVDWKTDQLVDGLRQGGGVRLEPLQPTVAAGAGILPTADRPGASGDGERARDRAAVLADRECGHRGLPGGPGVGGLAVRPEEVRQVVVHLLHQEDAAVHRVPGLQVASVDLPRGWVVRFPGQPTLGVRDGQHIFFTADPGHRVGREDLDRVPQVQHRGLTPPRPRHADNVDLRSDVLAVHRAAVHRDG